MRKTSVDIDEELLEEVRALLKTSTIKETIDCAFHEILRIEARRQEVQSLIQMEDLDLADEKVMAGAWRS